MEVLKIRFDLILEDVIAFQSYYRKHHSTRAPGAKRQLFVTYWSVPILGALLLLRHVMEEPPFWPVATLIWVACCATWFLYLRHYYGKAADDETRKLFEQGKNRCLFCWHELELDDSTLRERTELNQDSLDLKAVENIETTDQYTFVLYSALQAHVIPANRVTEGDYSTFVAALRDRWEKVTSNQS